MKRIATVLLLAIFVSFTLAAKITDEVWGLTIGKSTRSQVERFIKDNNLKIIDNKESSISCFSEHLMFEDINWDMVKFEFFNNTLYLIRFTKTRGNTLMDFKELYTDLDNKNSQYCSDAKSNDNVISVVYDDNTTCVKLSIDRQMNELEGHAILSLIYANDELLLKSTYD